MNVPSAIVTLSAANDPWLTASCGEVSALNATKAAALVREFTEPRRCGEHPLRSISISLPRTRTDALIRTGSSRSTKSWSIAASAT